VKNILATDTTDKNGAEHDNKGRFTKKGGSPLNDSFGQAHTTFSGKPHEAIEYLLKVKNGYVPAAFHRDDIGDIDLPYGQGGKKGFGLAHIIERRNEQGLDGESFAKKLPLLIKEGTLEVRTAYQGRVYIIHNKMEAAIRLEWDGEKKNWIVSALSSNRDKYC